MYVMLPAIVYTMMLLSAKFLRDWMLCHMSAILAVGVWHAICRLVVCHVCHAISNCVLCLPCYLPFYHVYHILSAIMCHVCYGICYFASCLPWYLPLCNICHVVRLCVYVCRVVCHCVSYVPCWDIVCHVRLSFISHYPWFWIYIYVCYMVA